MNKRLFSAAPVLVGIGLLSLACGQPSESPSSKTNQGEIITGTADPCAGKTCGTDCTPLGSDEPFNCDATGACVATGQPLGCAP